MERGRGNREFSVPGEEEAHPPALTAAETGGGVGKGAADLFQLVRVVEQLNR